MYEAARATGNAAQLAEAQQHVVNAQRIHFTYTSAVSHEGACMHTLVAIVATTCDSHVIRSILPLHSRL